MWGEDLTTLLSMQAWFHGGYWQTVLAHADDEVADGRDAGMSSDIVILSLILSLVLSGQQDECASFAP